MLVALPLSASSPSVSLAVSVQSSRIGWSSDLRLNVDLKNESATAVTVFGRLLFGASGGLILRIVDSEGNTVTSPFLLDEQVPPAVLRKTESYVLLQPNHYLGTTLVQPVKDLFTKRGTYVITVQYLSPVSRRYFTGINPVARELGLVTSNRVRVAIE
jgi:hypothetical protein